MCDCPDTITRRDARRMAGYLHTAHVLMVNVQRGEMPANKLDTAKELIGRVSDTFLDLRGQTDFYGNPTHSCDIRKQEERITL